MASKVVEVALYSHPDDPSKVIAEAICCDEVFSATGDSEEEALAKLKDKLAPRLGEFKFNVHRIH